jgi:hypothetical protein
LGEIKGHGVSVPRGRQRLQCQCEAITTIRDFEMSAPNSIR